MTWHERPDIWHERPTIYYEPSIYIEYTNFFYSCPNCGKLINCYDKFCKHCGFKLVQETAKKTCPHCGKEIE